LALALASGVLGGCNTPSVPIPPPALQALRFQDAGAGPGVVVLSGMPHPTHANARFYVFNQSRGDGVITTARADGSFTTSPFAGTDGDTVRMYFDDTAGERSAEVCVFLQLDAGLISQKCP
jgi:hypothetical protein